MIAIWAKISLMLCVTLEMPLTGRASGFHVNNVPRGKRTERRVNTTISKLPNGTCGVKGIKSEYSRGTDRSNEEPSCRNAEGRSDSKNLLSHSYVYADEILKGWRENRCLICDVYFRLVGDYQTHCADVHGIRKAFGCSECRVLFTTKSILLTHLTKSNAHSKRRHLESSHCGICEMDVPGGRKGLEIHAETAHRGARMIACSLCPNTYTLRRLLKTHAWEKHGGKEFASMFKCKLCRNVFDRTDVLAGHAADCQRRQRKKREGDIVRNCVKANMKDVRIRCDECPDIFESFPRVREHYKKAHSDVKLHPCGFCGKPFARKNCLERHVDKIHANEDGDIKTSNYRKWKAYACPHCGKEMKGLNVYEEHAKEHPGRAMFFCKECGKGYSYRRSLWNHANDAHGDNGFKTGCAYCRRRFFGMPRLREHEAICKRKADRRDKSRMDGDPGRYCAKCDKVLYKTKGTFKKHVQRHKTYDFCPICDKGYNRIKNPRGLAHHMDSEHDVPDEVDVKLEF